MKLVIDFPDNMVARALVTESDGSRFIRLDHLPRWYHIEIVEEVTDKPKRGRKKTEDISE